MGNVESQIALQLLLKKIGVRIVVGTVDGEEEEKRFGEIAKRE